MTDDKTPETPTAFDLPADEGDAYGRVEYPDYPTARQIAADKPTRAALARGIIMAAEKADAMAADLATAETLDLTGDAVGVVRRIIETYADSLRRMAAGYIME